ncbi:RNA catabolic process [Mactra antiquata]
MARKPPTFDVFVGNLPQDATEKNLGKLFSPFGEIAGIHVKETSKVPPPFNKFAFVKFLCEPDAEKAIKDLDKTNIQGSSICVRRSEDRAHNKKRNAPDGGGSNTRQNTGKETDSVDSLRSGPILAGGDRNTGVSNRPQMSFPGGPGSNQEKETVMVTYVENPITVWIQVVNDENTKTIFHVSEQLSTFCPSATPIKQQPELGKVYACLFAEDNMWYRCHVKQNLGTDQFKIQYIDYGNSEEVSLQSLIEIPANIANIKGLAIKVQLHNTRAKDISDKQAIQFLKSLTDNQMAQLVRTRHIADGSGCYGNLYVNDNSLSELMINAGYCNNRPVMGGKSNQSGKGLQNDSAFSDASGGMLLGPSGFAGGGGGGGGNRGGNAKRDRNTMSPLNQPSVMPQSMGQQQMMPNLGFPLQIGVPQQQQDHGREKKLQSQLSKKSQEVEKLRSEKDACNMQIEYMKSKIKDLQEEFTASAAKLQEGTLSKRISTVVALAEDVRHLRKQFPTSAMSCLLEDAMKLSMSDDHVDHSRCRTLTNVGSALALYKSAQDEISKCKDASKLKEMVTARDESRRELYSSVCTFLEEMENLPLQERSKQIQEAQSKIVNVYGDYLKFPIHEVPNLENIANGFKTWKTKKDCEFKDIRTATDFCEEALQTSLNHVQQIISLGMNEQCEKSDVDIDNLFKTYAHALQREINATNMVQGKDAKFVTTVIASIRKELHNEASTLENFSMLYDEFAGRKRNMEPWLDKSPTFTELQENRKLLRSLKSKLRHTLADKLDLEESGDEGDLDSIKEEEEKIRSQLQAALTKSDTLLHDVAALANENFPELIVQYPDLGIDSYLVYKGLVKANREIDQYSLQSGFRPEVHISTFNGEPVLLQEFHVGDDNHCSKEEFMKQVVDYNENNDVQAVFFSKNDRLAYVQTEWNGGEVIEQALKSAEYTKKELVDISICIAEKVVNVHKRGCIHGEITPLTVLLCPDRTVVLALPDFSKKPVERSSKRYVSGSGLVFQCPEHLYSSPETMGTVADVYNLVLLTFWLYFPSHSLASLRNKNPELNNMHSSLFHMFHAVLNSNQTADQVKAEHVLRVLQEAATATVEPVAPVSREPEPSSSQKPDDPLVQAREPEPTVESLPPLESLPPPVIKSTDEPMEIGVFRAEDYETAPNLVSSEPNPVIATITDTDNSWTTESSLSGSSGSRGSSPLDNTVCEKVPVTENLSSVLVMSSDTDVVIEKFSDIKLPTADNVSDSKAVPNDDCNAAPETNNTATGTTFIENPSELKNLTETNNGCDTDSVTMNEQGAACEGRKITLKMLLNSSRAFLTDAVDKPINNLLTSQNGNHDNMEIF